MFNLKSKIKMAASQVGVSVAKKVIGALNTYSFVNNYELTTEYIEQKVADYKEVTGDTELKLTVFSTLAIAPASLKGTYATYNAQTHELQVNLETMMAHAAYFYHELGDFKLFVDSVVAHELGHAQDREYLQYRIECLMNAGTKTLSQQKIASAHMVMTAEMNAWKLGRRFAKDRQAYDEFNGGNISRYKGEFNAIMDIYGE